MNSRFNARTLMRYFIGFFLGFFALATLITQVVYADRRIASTEEEAIVLSPGLGVTTVATPKTLLTEPIVSIPTMISSTIAVVMFVVWIGRDRMNVQRVLDGLTATDARHDERMRKLEDSMERQACAIDKLADAIRELTKK